MMLPFPALPSTDLLFSMRLDVAKPIAKGRPRASVINGRAMLRTPKQTREMERAIKQAAHIFLRVHGFANGADTETIEGGRKVLTGNLAALVVGVWPRIKKMPIKDHAGRQWRGSVPDWDNVAKLPLDALNGLVYKDDGQICHGQGVTVYAAEGERAAIEVYIYRAPQFPPEFEGVAALGRNA